MDLDALRLAQSRYIETCIGFGLTALPLYEYLVTMDQEIELVWKRKTRFSLPSILLVSTRVYMVAYAIITVIAPSSCTGIKIFDNVQQMLYMAGNIQVALFSALRVSALYNRNVALFVAIFVLGLAPVGTNIFGQIHTAYTPELGTCLVTYNISGALDKKLVLVTRTPVIVADVLVLTLTWAKTYEQILLSRGSGISAPLSACLARDGALYFLTLLTVNILEIAAFRTNLGRPVANLAALLPPILINRFMLNLRQAGSGPNPSDLVNLNHLAISIPQLQLSDRVVGSMGEPLDHGGSVVPGEDDDEVYGENIEMEGHSESAQREEKREAQERSGEAGGSGAAAV